MDETQTKRLGDEALYITVAQAQTALNTVREHLTETVWLVAEAFGADRRCPGCQTVVRKLDKRKGRYTCAVHPKAPPP